MNKKCSIYREILFQRRVNGKIRFTQKELSETLGVSVSTVFHALQTPRFSHIVRVTGRFFVLEDYRKLLYLFATERTLEKDIIYKTYIQKTRNEIEAIIPPNTSYALYSGFSFLYNSYPADYDHVYIYAQKDALLQIIDRLRDSSSSQKKQGSKSANFFVINADPLFSRYPQPLFEQLFVDIWNAPEWYAKDFLKKLENEIAHL